MKNYYIDDCELYVLWNLYEGNLNCLTDNFITTVNLSPPEALSTGGNYFKINSHIPIEWNYETMEKVILKFANSYNFDVSRNGNNLVIYVNPNVRKEVENDVTEYLERFRDDKLTYNQKYVTKFIDSVTHQQPQNILKFSKQRDEILKFIDSKRNVKGNILEIENPFASVKMRKDDRNISSLRYSERNKLFFHTLLCLDATNILTIKKIGFGNNFNLMFDEKGVEYIAKIEILPRFEQWLRGNYITSDLSYNPDLQTLTIQAKEFKITGGNQKVLLSKMFPENRLPSPIIKYIDFDPELTQSQVKNSLNDLKKKLGENGFDDFFKKIGNEEAEINPKYLE